MSQSFTSRFVEVGGINTHYLEAGSGPPLVLLHSGEFGACSELSWENNIPALAEHFHVIAPDWLGFGQTDKLFDFVDMFQRRISHMTDFLRTIGITSASFAGNSMAGGILAYVASLDEPVWPIEKVILVSGGGHAPDNDARKVLNSYDCTKEHMRECLKVLLYHERWWQDPYLERRWQLSLVPGSWECTAAARFKSVESKKRPSRNRNEMTRYENIKAPTLIVAGKQDILREPGYAEELQKQIPGSELMVYDEARHCPHMDQAEAFNRLAIDFLRS